MNAFHGQNLSEWIANYIDTRYHPTEQGCQVLEVLSVNCPLGASSCTPGYKVSSHYDYCLDITFCSNIAVDSCKTLAKVDPHTSHIDPLTYSRTRRLATLHYIVCSASVQCNLMLSRHSYIVVIHAFTPTHLKAKESKLIWRTVFPLAWRMLIEAGF